jgi:glucose-1-phosphate adenylyltransferase
MESEGKNILHRWGFTFSMRALLEELMSDPETKDFGKEIIPQAVGNRNILSYPI